MLEKDIGEIRENLRTESYPNESAVRQGIVQRLLGSLGWPIYDPQVVYPEYTLEGGRVDYALCHPASKPRIFIEVKQVGQSDGAEQQLFEYASHMFHMGVQLAVLTDGREWSFFLPARAGSYAERRIYKLNLVEHDVARSVQKFERYLRYEAVRSEEAFIAAQEDYRDIVREREIHEALPKAWTKLVAEENEYLIDAVAECVDDLCGHRPTPDTVASFLRTLQPGRRALSPPAHPPAPLLAPEDQGPPNEPTIGLSQQPTPTISHPTAPEKAPVGFHLFDKFYPCRKGREILVGVFEALAERDPTFIERFVALPRHGTKRRYLAVDPKGLHPADPRRARENAYTHRLKSGHWLLLQVDHKARANMIKLACKVAGVSYGTDLKINNPPIRPRPRARGRKHA